MNELELFSKFIFAQFTGDTYWTTNFTNKGTKVFAEVVPTGVDITKVPAALFTLQNADDVIGAFGLRLYIPCSVEIKVVMANTEFKLLGDGAKQIDRLFDWQNQIDIAAGRPRSSEVFIDPSDSTNQLMIHCSVRTKPIKYTTFDAGSIYIHLGGEYSMEISQV